MAHIEFQFGFPEKRGYVWAFETKKPMKINGFSNIGGVDGTRTRDPRRDRPVF